MGSSAGVHHKKSPTKAEIAKELSAAITRIAFLEKKIADIVKAESTVLQYFDEAVDKYCDAVTKEKIAQYLHEATKEEKPEESSIII